MGDPISTIIITTSSRSSDGTATSVTSAAVETSVRVARYSVADRCCRRRVRRVPWNNSNSAPMCKSTFRAQWPLFLSCYCVAAAALLQLTAGLALPPPPPQRETPRNTARYGLSVRRNEVLDVEERIRMGAEIPKMSNEEIAVNELLSAIKDEEIGQGFNDSSKFLASHHFFRVKEKIESSEVFKFIQMMPKGALLHGHNTALVSSHWFIQNVTYRPGIIMYTTEQNVLRFTFKTPASNYNWSYVADKRSASRNAREFDKYLETHINLYTPQPEIDYPDIDVVWKRFQNMFETVREVLKYLPVFVDYHYQLLQELLDDNIMYAEIRTGAGELYDEMGQIYSGVEAVQLLQNIEMDFRARNPNFFGAKIIYATSRKNDPESFEDLNKFRELQARFPDFLIGYDIVGQETVHNPNSDYAEQIQLLAKDTRFFFHAGETNWLGTPMDNNVIDALLWNTTRIGHGYALIKHPVLWKTVRQRRIAVEVCPLSNQVLKLVLDMRNHPATFYISEDIPIVIGSDDPGFWGAKGLSYDFYYAFMAFFPAYSGLEVLKRLVFASIEHSVLTDAEWYAAQKMLQRQWNEFLQRVLKRYGGSKNADNQHLNY